MGALRPESRDALLGLSIQDGTLLGATLSTVGGNCPLRICALQASNVRRLHQDPAFQARQVDRQQLRRNSGGLARLCDRHDSLAGPTETIKLTNEESVAEPDDFYEGRI